eukprot:806397_1
MSPIQMAYTSILYNRHFFICIMFGIIFEIPSCSTSFLIGDNHMHYADSDMAIGYNDANDTILLLGGFDSGQHFAAVKDDNFIDHGKQFLDWNGGVYGHGQFYIQLSNILWMINPGGTEMYAFDTNTYQTLVRSPSIAIPKETACLASIDDYLIVVGGGFNNVLDQIQIYHLTDDQWLSNTPSLKTPRSYLACIIAHNKLYAIGGFDDKAAYLNSIEVLDVSNMATISSTSWYYMDCTLQKGRDSLRAALYGTDMIYVTGGSRNNAVVSVDIINTVTHECLVADDLNFAVTSAASIIVQNTLFVFGGITNLNSLIVDG